MVCEEERGERREERKIKCISFARASCYSITFFYGREGAKRIFHMLERSRTSLYHTFVLVLYKDITCTGIMSLHCSESFFVS